MLTYPPFAADVAANEYQYAVPPVANWFRHAACALSPSDTRFRVFTIASVDSSHVYVSMCDASAIADVNTSDANINNTGGSATPADSLITDLPAAYAGRSQVTGSPVQNPIFMLTGQ